LKNSSGINPNLALRGRTCYEPLASTHPGTQGSADDAEALANELGTRTVPMLTSQVDFVTGETAKGSVRRVEEYRIHPNLFRDLPVGQAVVFARPSERRAIVRIYRDAL
jgi:hypothetical protein